MAKPNDPPGNVGGDNGGGGQPPAGGGSGQPAGQGGGGGGADDAQLGAAIEAAVRKVFAEATSAGGQPPAGGSTGQPVPPPAGGSASQLPAGGDTGGGSIGELINAAVRKALDERDRDDAVAVLGDEIDRLKALVAGARPERKAGWGSILLGPGLSRR